VVFEGANNVKSSVGNGTGLGRRSADFPLKALLYFGGNFRLGRGRVLLDRIRSALDGILKAPHSFAQTLAKLG
jgi:hypothetical protein